MKNRLILAILVLLACGVFAGCDDGESRDQARPDQAKPDNNTISTGEDKTRQKIKDELTPALDLVNKAKDDLDRNDDEAQENARRTLGYPSFVLGDFKAPTELVLKFKNNRRELSQYLFDHFQAGTKDLIQNSGESGDDVLKALRTEFNRQLKNKDLYDPLRFPKVPKEDPPARERLPYRNRQLLQDAYKEYMTGVSGETALSHLGKARVAADSLGPADLKKNVQSKIDDAKNSINQLLLSDNSANGNENALQPADLANAGLDISYALNELKNPDSLDKKSIFPSLGIVEILALSGVVLLFFGGIIWLILHQGSVSAKRDEAVERVMQKIFERQKKLEQELVVLKEQSNGGFGNLTDKVAQLDHAHRMLAKQVSQSGSRANNVADTGRYAEPMTPVAREEPEFPVAVDAYLRRMDHSKRQSTVVRPDFQNGILVKDPEDRGELVLIQDPRIPEEIQRLFVIPSVPQFQMKQDFYNYYDRYFDCEQPSAGEVWIMSPAVVEKVEGGWRLVEKGCLEVR